MIALTVIQQEGQRFEESPLHVLYLWGWMNFLEFGGLSSSRETDMRVGALWWRSVVSYLGDLAGMIGSERGLYIGREREKVRRLQRVMVPIADVFSFHSINNDRRSSLWPFPLIRTSRIDHKVSQSSSHILLVIHMSCAQILSPYREDVSEPRDLKRVHDVPASPVRYIA